MEAHGPHLHVAELTFDCSKTVTNICIWRLAHGWQVIAGPLADACSVGRPGESEPLGRFDCPTIDRRLIHVAEPRGAQARAVSSATMALRPSRDRTFTIAELSGFQINSAAGTTARSTRSSFTSRTGRSSRNASRVERHAAILTSAAVTARFKIVCRRRPYFSLRQRRHFAGERAGSIIDGDVAGGHRERAAA